MSDSSSITAHIEHLRQGSPTAARKLWEHYFERLARVAAKRLTGVRRVRDEEDLALSVLATVFRRVEQGEFPELTDRHDFWRILLTVTERKTLNQLRNERRQKRGSGKVRGESVFSLNRSRARGIEARIIDETTPELVASMKESFDSLLNLLEGELRQIALMKFEGYSNQEIAARIDRSVPTVERRLQVIRSRWSAMLDNPEAI